MSNPFKGDDFVEQLQYNWMLEAVQKAVDKNIPPHLIMGYIFDRHPHVQAYQAIRYLKDLGFI